MEKIIYPQPLIAAAEQAEGISALGLNLRSFVFQLISFIIVLLLLKRFVFKKIVHILDNRAERVQAAEKQVLEAKQIIDNAQSEAVEVKQTAREKASEIVAHAEEEIATKRLAAEKQLVDDLAALKAAQEEQRLVEAEKLRRDIAKEVKNLVALTTEKVMNSAITEAQKSKVLEAAEKELRL